MRKLNLIQLILLCCILSSCQPKIEKKERELNEHLESELRIIKQEKDEIVEKKRQIFGR